jgi:hypothetical protein
MQWTGTGRQTVSLGRAAEWIAPSTPCFSVISSRWAKSVTSPFSQVTHGPAAYAQLLLYVAW